jgi:anaerobic magnesium-protoporphyrin IX monomethyl ester cyclase
MKILLFNPPTPEGKRFIREGRCTQEEGAWGTLWPPLSLASAAAVLERAGHVVKLKDFPAEDSGLRELDTLVRSWHPELAIWSSATPSINSDLAFAALLKKELPGIITCTFGTHVGTLMEECFTAFPDLDYIIRGEPELTVQELVKALEGKKAAEGVPGLAFRRQGKELVVTEARALPKNLDDIPDPAWHLLNLNAYRLPLKGHKFLMVVPTRGCPYACSFCTTHSYYGSQLRRRSPARVVQEIRRNVESFGVRDFLFWSDTFTLDRQYVKDLCQAFLDAKLDISWACNSRVDTADLETFKIMKRAGCWMVSYGIESSSQDVLNLSKKGAEVQDVGQAVRWTKDAGLMATGHFVLGLPGDTPASIQETIDFSNTLGLDFAQYYCAVPFPGSSLYTEAKKNGWLPAVPWEEFRQDNALLQLPGLPPETVERLRNEAYSRFYSNPRAWLSKLQMIRPAAFPKMFSTLKAVVGWRHSLPDPTA